MHAQPPREIECCAELGRSGRLTGSLRFPVIFEANPGRMPAQASAKDPLSFFTEPLYSGEVRCRNSNYVGVPTQLKGWADACSRNWASTLSPLGTHNAST